MAALLVAAAVTIVRNGRANCITHPQLTTDTAVELAVTQRPAARPYYLVEPGRQRLLREDGPDGGNAFLLVHPEEQPPDVVLPKLCGQAAKQIILHSVPDYTRQGRLSREPAGTS